MDADFLALKAENERLRAQVAALEAQVQRLLAENRQLLAANQKLLAALEQTRREGKRKAAPLRKPGGPKPNPQQPSRKPGDAYGAQFSLPAPRISTSVTTPRCPPAVRTVAARTKPSAAKRRYRC